MAGLKHTETIRIESLKLAIAEAEIIRKVGPEMSKLQVMEHVERRYKQFESMISEED